MSANQYPYTASGSSVGASLLPRWAEVGGGDSLRARIADPATRARLVTEMTENLRRRGGAASLLMTSTRDLTILGKTLEQIAQARNIPPVEAAIQIILNGGSSVASFNINEKDIEAFMRRPWVMTGSDGSGWPPTQVRHVPQEVGGIRTCEEDPHARSIRASVQRAHGRDVRDQGSWRAGEGEVRGRRRVR